MSALPALLLGLVVLSLAWHAAYAGVRRSLVLAMLAVMCAGSGVLGLGLPHTSVLGHLPAGLSGTSGAEAASKANGDPEGCRRVKRVVRVRLSRRKYPHIVDHFRDVQRSGRHKVIWHIDRAGADENRAESLEGIPTKRGYDRDEVPPAIAREGGKGADVRYVRSSENRSAGATMGARLRAYCSGQRFRLVASR